MSRPLPDFVREGGFIFVRNCVPFREGFSNFGAVQMTNDESNVLATFLAKLKNYDNWFKSLISRGPRPAFDNVEEAMEDFKELIDLYQVMQTPIEEWYQRWLDSLEGLKGENIQYYVFALRTQSFAERLGFLFECQKEGCEAPAKLRFKDQGIFKKGTFHFEHYVQDEENPEKQRRTTHCSSVTIPRLILIRPHETGIDRNFTPKE